MRDWKGVTGRGVIGLLRMLRGRRETGARKVFIPRLLTVLLLGAAVLGFTSTTGLGDALANSSSAPAAGLPVGMEGRREVILTDSTLVAKTPDRRSPLLLRIASATPTGSSTHYDLRYVGRVPGKYDLRDFLFTGTGLPASNLPPLSVSITGLLPKEHNGWLEEQALRAPGMAGGYRIWMLALAFAWIAAPFIVARLLRKPKPHPVAVPTPRVPAFAERLRPLVERAAEGKLSADEQALLERMLIHYWQRRLELNSAGGSELMDQLRSHPEAGVLLRGLAEWLHRPPGRGAVNVEALLTPYRDAGRSHGEEVRA